MNTEQLQQFISNLGDSLEALKRSHSDKYTRLMADLAEALEKFEHELQSMAAPDR